MLTPYRRHKASCPHRAKGRAHRACRCPIWVDGLFQGQEIRQSLRVNTWDDAERELEALKQRLAAGEAKKEQPTLAEAWDEFERDAEARGLREGTVKKYKYLRADMEKFARAAGVRFVYEFNLEQLRRWRASWPNRNLSALKKLELVRSFFRFAHDAGWTKENPARKIRNPKITATPTLPFTREEMVRILAAADGEGAGKRRIRALILLLRHSGLRIGDAVTLGRQRINDDKLFLYTSKAGTPVWCPLPPFVIHALEAAPALNKRFYFWSGNGKPKTAISDWQEKLKKLFTDAKVVNGHAHRFRDTFATELLLAGVPIERVSILLGHSSIRITEKHYSPWVRSRQEQLEADVRRTWGVEIAPEPKEEGTRRGQSHPN